MKSKEHISARRFTHAAFGRRHNARARALTSPTRFDSTLTSSISPLYARPPFDSGFYFLSLAIEN